jgi:hypothetical protein
VYPYRRTGFAVDLASGKYVVKVCVCVDDTDDFQTHGFDRGHDPVRISTRIKNIADTGFGIADNGAIALQRSDRKGLADNIHK